jgi:hypothetical protein
MLRPISTIGLCGAPVLATSALSLLAFGLVARIVWWKSGRTTYFPSARACAAVHQNLPRWWSALRAYRPGGILAGLIAFVMWPCFVCLNVLLLAQVSELLMPGGQRIPLPWVGKYGVGPLVAGVLYTMAQVVVSITYSVAESAKARQSVLGVLLLTVVVEMGLAFWHASVVLPGARQAGESLMGHLMITGGPFQAMCIGFSVPAGVLSLSHP